MKKIKVLLAICTFLLCWSSPPSARAGSPQESGFSENTLVSSSSLSLITGIAWAPDGSNRLFISRKGGEVRIVKNGGLLSTPFATVSVFTNGECGLDGICFDPNFNVNHFVYVFAVVSSSKSQLIRFTANGDVGGSKTTILDNVPTGGQFHNGGAIGFGPDGKIYMAVGDNHIPRGVNGDLSSLAAKISRINPSGGPAPSDNPFNDGGGSNNDYIWARGFRNPFTMTFRPGGQLWLNVVGEEWEQVFLVKRGEHGGWNNFEGGDQPSGFIKPKIKYPSHGSSSVGSVGCVTGGAFYDSTQFPSSHRGQFFFCDYTSNVVMKSIMSGDSAGTPSKFVTGVSKPTDMATGPDGALYYAEHTNGAIRRLRHTGTSQDIVVWPTWLNMTEGGENTIMVSLKAAPSSNVTVNVARSAGDGDVTVAGGSSLTFTSSNWNKPQKVTIASAADGDSTNDSATIAVSSSGLTTQNVSVNVADTGGTIVLSKSTMTIGEGGTGTFTVKLSAQPSHTVTVSSVASGDSSVSVTGGSSLTFTTSNWATSQTVTVTAAEDSDTTTDSATISVSAVQYVTKTVDVTATDNDDNGPKIITNPPVTDLTENEAYTYDVDATGLPAPTYSLDVAPAGMTINSTTGVISWTPTSSQIGTHSVVVRATNSVGSDTQPFSITVGADDPPVASLTLPLNGDVVSGPNSEFYGDGIDDVGCPKAEFFVDGVLEWTDVVSGNHFHYNGAHNLWDTTKYPNGSHTVTFKVTDTVGHTASTTRTVTVSNGTGFFFEAENLLPVEASSGDVVRTLAETAASAGVTVQNDSNAVGDFFTLRMPNVSAGSYNVTVRFKKHPSRGIVQVLIGKIGGTLGNLGSPIDLYSATPGYVDVNIATWTPGSTSDKQISFQITGKNASSTGFTQNVDSIRLTPAP